MAKKALVHERRELVQGGAADSLGCFDGAASRETGQAHEQGLLARRQEVVAPVDRCSKRSLSCGRLAGAAGQEGQALLQARQQRLRLEHPNPSGSKLEPERKSIHAQTNLCDRARVVVGELEAWLEGLRALDEERYGGYVA